MPASAERSRKSGISSQVRSWLRSCLPEPVSCAAAMRPLLRRSLPRLLDEVAHAAHRADLHAGGLELLAQPVDDDLHGVARRDAFPAVEVVDELLLGDDLPL